MDHIDTQIRGTSNPVIFQDRGDPAAYDFTQASLTLDGAWHELDLSAIIPTGVRAIAMSIILLSTAVNKIFQIRTHGNVNPFNQSFANTQTANIISSGDFIVIPDVDGHVDYFASPPPWTVIGLTVKGWWF